MVVRCDLVSVHGTEFDSPVHVVSLVGVEQLQMVDRHLQDLGLLQLGRARFLESLRNEPLELVERAVDPVSAALLDGPASAFPVRAPVRLAPAGHGAVPAVVFGAVVAVADAVAPLHAAGTVHFLSCFHRPVKVFFIKIGFRATSDLANVLNASDGLGKKLRQALRVPPPPPPIVALLHIPPANPKIPLSVY